MTVVICYSSMESDSSKPEAKKQVQIKRNCAVGQYVREAGGSE